MNSDDQDGFVSIEIEGYFPDVSRETSEYPENTAVKVWRGDAPFPVCSIVYNDLRPKDQPTFHRLSQRMLHFYCGYVRTERSVFNPPINDFTDDEFEFRRNKLMWVPIHGGITFEQESDDGSVVYGFDCNHYMDADNDELRDVDGFLTAHVTEFAAWLQMLPKFDDENAYSEACMKVRIT